MSLHADAYTQSRWFELDQEHIIARSWQWVCHTEKLRSPGNFVTQDVAGFVFVNLDPGAAPLAQQSGGVSVTRARWAPDVEQLTFARRLSYTINTNSALPGRSAQVVWRYRYAAEPHRPARCFAG